MKITRIYWYFLYYTSISRCRTLGASASDSFITLIQNRVAEILVHRPPKSSCQKLPKSWCIGVRNRVAEICWNLGASASEIKLPKSWCPKSWCIGIGWFHYLLIRNRVAEILVHRHPMISLHINLITFHEL